MNTVSPGQYLPDSSNPSSDTARMTRGFKSDKFDFWSFFFSGLTGLATLLIVGILVVILVNIILGVVAIRMFAKLVQLLARDDTGPFEQLLACLLADLASDDADLLGGTP